MKIDLTVIGILLIVSSLIIGIGYYYNNQFNQCTSNPLSYGAKQMEDLYGYEFIGTGYFFTPINMKAPTIIFNSDNVSVQSS